MSGPAGRAFDAALRNIRQGKPLIPQEAKRCAWCGEWRSEIDRLAGESGSLVSHGICDDCTAEHFPDEGEMTNAQ